VIFLNNLREFYINLLKFTISNTDTVPPCEDIDAEAVFNICKKHDLLQMFYENAVSIGLLSKEDSVYPLWKESYILAKTKDVRQMIAVDEICQKLTSNSIRVMPLKGILIKELYPKTYYRKMTDLDILIDGENAKKAEELLTSIGYEMLHDDKKHFSMYKKPGITIEIHKNLFLDKYNDLFPDVWEKSKSNENDCYIMCDEDLVLHNIIHYGIHFRYDGIGIRALLDIHFLIKNYPDVLSSKSFNERLEKSGYKKFFNQIVAVSKHLFEKGELTKEQEIVEKYLLSSGNMGSAKDQAANYAGRIIGFQKRNKFLIFLNLIFPKYEKMCERFAILKKCPVLLPICWIIRILRVPLYAKKAFTLIKYLFKTNSNEIGKRKEILDNFGIEK